MKARITAIGNEILIGQVVDTNSNWLAKKLTAIGFDIEQITAISDTPEAIGNALISAEGRVALSCFTGGLGPTSDDITRSVFTDYFGTELVLDEAVLQDVTAFLERRGRTDITALNRDQAMVPKNAVVLRNPVGTAPGSWFERSGTIFVSMPGVPYEMKQIMRESVLPRLVSRASLQLPVIHQKTVLTFGIPESDLSMRIAEWEAGLKEISLAYLPSPAGVRLRLTCQGADRAQLEKKLEREIAALHRIIPGDIYGYDEDNLAKVVGEMLLEKGATLATAESCTGGEIARQITANPGASRYYVGSVVAYALEVKVGILGVDPEDLERDGAVSQSVVEAMAKGARNHLGANYAVAVSGIAGPDGGSLEKPVGTVWIAAASAETVVSRRFQFGERRDVNIARSAAWALNMIRQLLTSDGKIKEN